MYGASNPKEMCLGTYSNFERKTTAGIPVLVHSICLFSEFDKSATAVLVD